MFQLRGELKKQSWKTQSSGLTRKEINNEEVESEKEVEEEKDLGV